MAFLSQDANRPSQELNHLRKASFLSKFFNIVYFFISAAIILGVFYYFAINHEGGDHQNNINSFNDAMTGYIGSQQENILMFALFDGLYYFTLSLIGLYISDNPELVLWSFSFIVLLIFLSPTLKRIAISNNKPYLYLLVFTIIMHPRFLDLILGNIRSGVALAILFLAIGAYKKSYKYILIFISPLFHLGTIVPVSLYIFYLFLSRYFNPIKHQNIFIMSSIILPGILVMLATLFASERGGGEWEGRMLYTSLIYCLAIYLFFISKYIVTTPQGFLTLSMISVVLFGSFLDYATMRYLNFFMPFFTYGILSIHKNEGLILVTLVFFMMFTYVAHLNWLLFV